MRLRGLLAAVLVLVAAACGGNDASNPFDTSSTVPGGTTAGGTSTTAGATSTTLPATTTTTLDPFLVDIYSIEPTPPTEPATGVNALLGGAPDEGLGAVLAAGLEAEGIDLTGVTIGVWPIGSTGDSLLIVDFDETAGTYAADDDAGNDLLIALLDDPLVDAAGITRLVMRIGGSDEEGAYVFTFTALVADLRQSLATGESLGEGEAYFQLERVEP